MTRKQQKVPVVTHVVSGDIWAGAEAQVYQLVRALQANQTVTPTAVVFNDGDLMQRLKAAGVPVTLADERVESPLGLIRGLCRHFRHHGTAIVHTHGFKENVLGTLAQKLSRVPRSVRTAHGNPEAETSWRNPKRKITTLLDQATARYGQDAVVAVSGQLESDLSRAYPDKTVKIRNFIEIPELSQQAPLAKSIESTGPEPAQNEAPTAIRIGLVGRLVPVKRADIFIDTVGLLKSQLSAPVKGIIIGDGPLREALEAYTREKGLADSIEFRGFVANPAQELEQLDLLMMPSDHEGIPMVLLESLLASLPIVAHNVGGIPEILDDGQCGYLVDEHSPTGYAAKAAELLSNPELMEQFRRAGRAHLLQEFNKDKNARKYEALYNAIYFEPGRPLTTIFRSTRSQP
ncbi:glycosyltransferase [Marinobacter salicampi]|uniref:glycosyltransferase n=1 Tax=Marinobacter salicampi TaxID=435907 RepID=UPI001407F0C9|nr:glycosyltransferase [Marinobacter salicampi]